MQFEYIHQFQHLASIHSQSGVYIRIVCQNNKLFQQKWNGSVQLRWLDNTYAHAKSKFTFVYEFEILKV